MSDLPPPDANGWRPIESAPKHGLIVLTDGGYWIAGFWCRVRWMAGFNSEGMQVTIHLTPTHWQPLPEGPVS